MQPPSDAQLAVRGAAGDRGALDEIYRRYRPIALATARRLLREPADADDAVQETFLLVFRHLAQLAEPGALSGWIARIAARRAHRVFRVRRLTHRHVLADPGAALDRQASGGARPDLVAELALLDDALDLPPALRAAWLGRHVGGLSLPDIAARRGWSLATTKRRLADARARIARHVGRDAPGVDRPARAPVVGDSRPERVDAITTARSIS
jgi:RNA polymerase sigma-70 factor, ECF subfamily